MQTKNRRWIVILGVAAVLMLEWQLLQLNWDTNWSVWMNRVSIAAQTGNPENLVLSTLGKPTQVYDTPGDVIGKLAPTVPDAARIRKVYRYFGLFPLNGLWHAYIYIGESGRVVGFYVRST